MSRRKTDGERIAKRAFSGQYESRGEAFPSELAVEINRLVRRRMVEARKEIERQRDENARLRADVPVYSSVIEQKRLKIEQLREALTDMLSGWRYIRETYGDLAGIGWDRAEQKARKALEGGR